MIKIFISNLAPDATRESVLALFSEYGTVRSIKLSMDIFSGKCKGFGFIEMEGHEARAAMAGLDGSAFEGNFINVKYEKEQKGRRR